MTNKIRDIENMDKALDIFEQAHNLSDEQLTSLRNDSELRDDVAMLSQLRESLSETMPIDVEARLKQFHAKRSTEREEKKPLLTTYRRLIATVASVAAIFLGAIVFQQLTSNDDSMNDGVVYEAYEKTDGITLTTNNGEKITLTQKGKPVSNATLTDFRNILAQVGAAENITLDVPVGSSADITLPDGTIVYMHPGAKIVFPAKFAGSRREVAFDGEAYFKVAHDKVHPFVITSGNMETTVLGTEFNISTDRQSVVLVNGSVRLRETVSNAEVTLKPNQQALFTSDNGAFTVNQANVEPYEFWRDGYLYFEEAELKDIMIAIGKNFNMSVVFLNKDALCYRMRFITPRNQGVETAIKTMNEMGKAHVSVKENTIYVGE